MAAGQLPAPVQGAPLPPSALSRAALRNNSERVVLFGKAGEEGMTSLLEKTATSPKLLVSQPNNTFHLSVSRKGNESLPFLLFVLGFSLA